MKAFIGALFFVAILIIINIIGQCNQPNVNKKQTFDTSLSDNAIIDTSSAALRAMDTDTVATETNSSKWTYSENEDKMTSKKTYFAMIDSPTDLNFSFPYEGSSAGITLRKKRGDTDIILQVTKGQFVTPYDGTTIRARFDEEPAGTYSCSEPSDHSSNVLFIQNENKFITKLKKHKKLIIEAEFYHEGLKQIEFDISGLKWAH